MLNNLLRSLVLFSTLVFISGIGVTKSDPFEEYRDFVKGPLVVKYQDLKNFKEEEKLIREKLTLNLSKKERAILSGLHWIVCLIDDEKKFKPLFSDFLLLMESLRNSHGRVHQREAINAIIKKSLALGLKDLDEIFPDMELAGWRFLGLLALLEEYPLLKKEYIKFYDKRYPYLNTASSPPISDFKEAMNNSDYKELFDYLVMTSFAHHSARKVKDQNITMPKNRFKDYLKEFENFDYKDHPISDMQFRGLGYLATHIPLVLTNYGELLLKDGINTNKVKNYIESSFKKAYELGDFDLFAEYILCLKIFDPKDKRILELEGFLYDLQRPDGSWGSEKDFTTNAYTAIHPSGAALMALNMP